MKLSAEIASRTIDIVYAESGLKAFVCDASGTIIAAVDKERIGTTDSGACRIFREGLEEVVITPEEEEESGRLVRVGVNLPIKIASEVVGTYGVEGELAFARSVARISVGLIRNDIVEEYARRQIQEKEQRLQSLFSRMIEGVALHEVILDADEKPINYRIIAVNDSYESHVGLKREDICGKLATEVYGTSEAPYLHKFTAVGISGVPDYLEVYFEPLDKHFVISVAPWGKNGFATIFSDVSEQKKTQRALQESYKNLQQKVDERTQELTAVNEELTAQTEEMAAMNEELEDTNRALAVENDIRQQQEQEIRLREKQYQATTSLLTRSTEDVQALLEAILQDALLLVGAPGGHITLVDEGGKNFVFQYTLGFNKEEQSLVLPVDQGMLGQVYRSGELLCVEDYRTYLYPLKRKQLCDLTTAILVPLKQEGRVKGVLTANWKDDVHPITAEDMEVFKQYGDLVSIALERSRALQQISYQNELLKRLAKTTAYLVDELDLDKVLRNILDQAGSFMGIQHWFVILFEEDEKQARIQCGSGRYAGLVGQVISFDGKGLLAEILRTGKLVVVNDYAQWPDRQKGDYFDDITASMQAPLNIAGKTIGTIGMTIFEEKLVIDPEKLAVFEHFANVAAIAIKNALAHQKTNYQAFHDSLTGLPNRAYLNLRLEQELEKARTGENLGAVLFIDLDDLKTVNDSFGHSCGDGVIQAAAKQIAATVGPEVFLARVGGDEFVVILQGEDNLKNTANIAGELVSSSHREYEVGGRTIHMSASVGVTIYPNDGDNVEDVLKNADSAMYAAKAAGRNCWRFYMPEMLKDIYAKMVMTNDLRHALERGELYLHYQPQISLKTEAVVGFEALLRWRSAEHGMVPPVHFIPLAEQSGLIHSIGKWVFEESCRFAQLLAGMGRKDLHVAVNVSPRQLAADDFVDLVRRCLLEGEGTSPSQLEIEITENVLIDSLESSTQKLNELCSLGVRLALDDFGTGFSSLTYLRTLPVEIIKIDKTFIDRLLEDNDQEGFVRLIVEMAHVLGLTVVAEGVEVELQRAKLIDFGCDCAQGYLFSKPVSQEEAIRFLSR